MAALKANVVVLDEYRKGDAILAILDIPNVEIFLESAREEIRNFDSEVYDLLREKHKLKFAEACRNRVLEYEQALLLVSDWLNDKIDDEENTEKKNYERLLEECEKLIVRNERTKKNIVDDLASCRHYENKRESIKIVGFALVTPVGVYNLIKILIPAHEKLAWIAAIGGAVIGTSVAFQDRTEKLIGSAKKTVANSPSQIRRLGKATRTSFISAAFRATVASKKISDIELSIRRREMLMPKTVYIANKM